ncbi:MAG: hypothetical protein EHM32_03185 [Spirochaetales bacterium]|nr:MAG: hypothetical protein EHM32_03185 [Spirochaetales bacterium]
MRKKHFRIHPVLWILIDLILIDAAINLIFAYPNDPRNITPSKLQQFFEYGRSIEGKLARMTRMTDNESAPILKTGWLDDFDDETGPIDPLDPRPIVTVYGMSHAVILAREMDQINDSLIIRRIGAPGGVPSWSYAAYLSDSRRQHSDIVVLGIMTRGIPLICTTSGATNHFDSVHPYTYPRFYLNNGRLDAVWPPFVSRDGYRDFYYDKAKWEAYLSWLRDNDKYYDRFLFHKSLGDHSSLFRMLRRSVSFSMTRKMEASVYDRLSGFKSDTEEINILRAVIVEFSQTAKRNGSIPIIYIVNNVFMSDHLFRALEPTLRSHDILYLSSHELCDPNNPKNYDSSSHFVPSINTELSKKMIRIIRDHHPRKRTS